MTYTALDLTTATEAEVFDFDNTLADVRAIEHLLDFSDPFLTVFHDATATCPPVAYMLAKARAAQAQGRAVIISTFRPELVRASVEDWMATFAPDVTVTACLMRADDDTRDSATVKAEHFNIIESSYVIASFNDDNLSNCEMAQARGILTEQADPAKDSMLAV